MLWKCKNSSNGSRGNDRGCGSRYSMAVYAIVLTMSTSMVTMNNGQCDAFTPSYSLLNAPATRTGKFRQHDGPFHVNTILNLGRDHGDTFNDNDIDNNNFSDEMSNSKHCHSSLLSWFGLPNLRDKTTTLKNFNKNNIIINNNNKINNNMKKKLKPTALALLTATILSPHNLIRPPPALASAPVTAIKKFKAPDQKADALKKYKAAIDEEKLQKAMAYQVRCEEIEAEHGKEARAAFEAKHEAAKAREAAKKAVERKQLQYKLIDQGMCPFTDVEGARQMYLFDNGIDLNLIPTTPQNNEIMSLTRFPKLREQRATQRFIVKCMVDDVRLAGGDPLEYLETNQEQTSKVYCMKEKQGIAIMARYKEIIQNQGSLSGNIVEKPFNMDVAMGLVAAEDVAENTAEAAKKAKLKSKAEAAKLKAEIKEKKRAAREAAKLAAAKLKAEAKAAKEAAKEEVARVKLEAKDEAAKIAAAVAAVVDPASPTDDAIISSSDESPASDLTNDEMAVETIDEEAIVKDDSVSKTSFVSKIPIVPAATVVGVAGGGYAFKLMKQKSAEEEEERQRQFKLIMGLDDDDDDEDEDDGDSGDDIDAIGDTILDSITTSPTPSSDLSTASSVATADAGGDDVSTAPTSETPKKRRRMGLSSVFSKKNANTRETDLTNLVSSDAIAPEFATLLSKILTFGAPGRFPAVAALSGGDMPMDEFDLEKAKELLIESRATAGLTDEVSAETFACVVNCMIIDIIDLASSSLGIKEKKDKVTVDALNVVMDFMDHAASLFDAVADGVTITPVTYGGTLGKSKLEQMFAIYASSMMTSFDGSVTQDRVDTLQQVFNISDKKAEGLIQKNMMKNLMNMMKNGGEGMEGMEGMEGLSEMMAAMGGADGMGIPGLGGLDGDISEEELKQSVAMMKELVDSGSVSKEELDLVRSQFKEAYGSDITDLIKEADKEGASDELGEDGKELLDLFKTILKEEG